MLPYRPLTVGDLLDGAFRLVRDRFGRVALLVLLLLGPYQLLVSFLTAQWMPAADAPLGEPTSFEVDLEAVWAGAGLFTLVSLGGVLVYLVAAGALVALVLGEDRGIAMTLPDALRSAAGRLWPLVGGSLLVWLAGLAAGVVVALVGLLPAALALPLGVLVWVVLGLATLVTVLVASTLVIPVAMVERDRGAVAVVGRVTSLLRRRYWRMVGVVLLVLLVLLAVTMAISIVLGLLSLLAGPFAWVVDGMGGTLVSVVTTPVLVFTALLLYLDARVRLEGWDLALRARSRPW